LALTSKSYGVVPVFLGPGGMSVKSVMLEMNIISYQPGGWAGG
jgi:hypothetical protein